MTPLLKTNDWLIRPEALRSMAHTVRAIRERSGPLPQPTAQSPLLSVQDGIGTVAIEGPIIRKPEILARVLLGATSDDEIAAANREARNSANHLVCVDLPSKFNFPQRGEIPIRPPCGWEEQEEPEG